jgi:hypothetical protein
MLEYWNDGKMDLGIMKQCGIDEYPAVRKI